MRRARTVALLLTLLAGADVTAQPAAPLIVLDVPFLPQSEALCGGAAAAMVLRFWGARGLDAESFAGLVDRRPGGIATTRLVADLQSRGWNVRSLAGADELIAAEIDHGRPVLALIEERPRTFHYIVIVGLRERVVIFHDPARAPFRVMSHDEFERRWSRAGRWMAIVVPGPRTETAGASANDADRDRSAGSGPAITACEQLVRDGVARAQANDLPQAEALLTRALSCPGAAAVRELAGVRLLQERWRDVEELSAAAVAQDPSDQYAWRLLGTSRFVQNNTEGALDAWNVAGEPRLDLVRVDGLRQTREPIVEQLLGIERQSLVSRDVLVRSRRRLAELPSALSTSVDYVPAPGGLAELEARVVERPVFPHGRWSYIGLGLSAAATREVKVTVAAPTGGGERVAVAWRFWPGRERIGVDVAVPAPWGGIWGVDAFAERQAFDSGIASAQRTSASLNASNWLSPTLRLSVRAGLDRWHDRGLRGRAGAGTRWLSRDERLDVGTDVDLWAGTDPFALGGASLRLRSSAQHRGIVWEGRTRISLASATTPLDQWPAGDTGAVRPILLRAHPLIDDGALRVARLGRAVFGGSGEVQRWVTPARLPLDLAVAAFVDTAGIFQRLDAATRGDVDAGIGLRLTVPGVPGRFRLDAAQGLRDRARALSFVYEP